MKTTSPSATCPPSCSMKSLWKICLPLMISSFATLFMIFVDRCFLAAYSLDSLNAAVNAGTLAWAYLGALGMITGISGVFVAQFFGANQLKKIGQPVWQMIWVSLFSFLVLIPIGIWSGPIIFQNFPYSHLQEQYFSILLTLGPFTGVVAAISGFYIGRGKAKLLLVLAVAANLVNIVFDRILIFGIEGIVPEMGIAGAAIATTMGSIFQAIILLFMFLKKTNHLAFGTRSYKIQLPLMIQCLKIATPQAIFYGLEIIGWALFYLMMTSLSEVHITVSGICQSIILLLSFFFDGLTKGVSSIAGQVIGGRQHEKIPHLFRSSFYLLCFFTLFSFFVVMGFPQFLIQFLLPQNTFVLPTSSIMTISLICVIGYLFFEGIRWILSGILTAAGDTLFLLIGGSLSVWFFLLLPVYMIVVRNSLSVEIAWILAVGYAAILTLFYYGRYLQGKWKKIELISTSTEESRFEESGDNALEMGA